MTTAPDTVEDGFTLHPRLAADTVPVGRLPVSALLLMNEATYPWVILVPRRHGVRELHDLSASDRAALIEEVAQVSLALADLFTPDKLNVGALGNIVDQLHVHIVGRSRSDPAWPGPVWGHATPRPYPAAEAHAVRVRIAARLATVLQADPPDAV